MILRSLTPFPVESDALAFEARQVLRDFDERPHLLMRLKLEGTHFPERALEPFVTVGDLRSRFVEISADGESARAYFDQAPPEGGRVEYGYGHEALLRFPKKFREEKASVLDVDRLPEGTRWVERFTRQG